MFYQWKLQSFLFILISIIFFQVLCDANLVFLNVVAKWAGSVHDARILRNSALFEAFESERPPLQGVILGDGGYFLRPWLMTPFRYPATPSQRRYNTAHARTRNAVERCIGVVKQRFHCLRTAMRVSPEKACSIITVCCMLHNRARRANLPPLPDDSEADSDNNSDDEEMEDNIAVQQNNERIRVAAGRTVRDGIVNRNF